MRKLLRAVLVGYLLFNLPIPSFAQPIEHISELRAKLDISLQNNRLESEEYIELISNETQESFLLSPKVKREINGVWHYIGKLKDAPLSTFRFLFDGSKMEGMWIDQKLQKAYKIGSDKLGHLLVEPTDIHTVICVEYDSSYTVEEPQAAVPIATSDVYKLQSNPASKSVAYLDFDGETVSGTLWASGNTINAVPGNFTETDIRNIFNLVSEDFAPFNINITTDVSVYEAATRTSRMRCIFTPTNTASPGAGGVAYVNSFTWGDGTPCWVFNGGAKAAGEAASHEIGHTLGLRHDGRTSPVQEYFSGHGNWAPIMGTGYTKSIVQWSIGEYNYANNKQDDISLITSRNGFGFKADDHGNTSALATALTVEANGSVLATNNKGLIERRTDVDFFRFTCQAGNIAINANPATAYPNLDIQLTLYDAQGNVLASSNPTGLAASINFNGTAGTYFLGIDGVGYGDPLSTGYTDYASIGVYTLSGSIPIATSNNLLPNVAITTPTTGSTYTAPATINITATAQDLDGTIQKVEFYSGTTKLGEDLTSPYQYSWTNVAGGNYNLTARAIDNKGEATTSAVVAVIVKKPACQVANAHILYDEIIGTSGSYNNNGYIKNFAFDDDSSTYFDAPSASNSWTGLELDGVYRITGIRFYPRSSYMGRMNGGKFQGSNTPDFSANVVDLATISTTPANEWNCITITNTTSFKYVRYLSPANGYCNVSEIEFYGTKVANMDPSVRISSPLNRTIATIPTTTSVNVTATDPDGSISKVELYNGNQKIGEDATSPYQFQVNMDSSQRWFLIAKAIDNLGEYATSDTVMVLARNPTCTIKGTLLSPTAILGTTGSWNNTGSTRDKAFDLDSSTFFNSPSANGSWVGVDLGSAKNIVGVRFYPRRDYQNRMLQGRFQIAANASFTSGVVNVDTILHVVNDEWNCIAFSRVYATRYIRYLSPNNSYGNIAELQIYQQEGGVTGLEEVEVQGGVEIYPNPAQDFVKIIHSNKNLEKATLYSVAGVKVREYASFQHLDLLGLESGFYQLELLFENGEKVARKLIIAK